MVWEQMIQSRRQLATTRLKRLFMTSRQIMRLRICQHQPVWFFFLAISACENSHVNVNKNKKIKLLRSHLNMLGIFKDWLSFDSRTATILIVTPKL